MIIVSSYRYRASRYRYSHNPFQREHGKIYIKNCLRSLKIKCHKAYAIPTKPLCVIIPGKTRGEARRYYINPLLKLQLMFTWNGNRIILIFCEVLTFIYTCFRINSEEKIIITMYITYISICMYRSLSQKNSKYISQ